MGSCNTTAETATAVSGSTSVATRQRAMPGGRQASHRRPQVRGPSRPYVVTSLSPRMPAAISAMQTMRAAVAGSANKIMPATATPMAPMPVHTA